REELVRSVYPLIGHALRLRRRLDAGDALDFKREHGILRASLSAGHLSNECRYALACWGGELFIEGSPWAGVGVENKLETALFGTNERHARFWRDAETAFESAATAHALPGEELQEAAKDALEVYALCAMLGFKGNREEADIRPWVVQARVL